MMNMTREYSVMSPYIIGLILLVPSALAMSQPVNSNNLNLSEQSAQMHELATSSVSNYAQDLQVAIAEMRAGTYYTFVMLVQMLGDRVPHNITFLMPNDQMLGQVIMAENVVSDFLMHHAIPQPLVFDNMLHFPTGSFIPTSFQNYMLKVSNNGRRAFFFNNAQIVSPNICRLSPSIRCHGISAVLNASPDTYPNGQIPCGGPTNSNSNGHENPCSAPPVAPPKIPNSNDTAAGPDLLIRTPAASPSPSVFIGPVPPSLNFTSVFHGSGVILIHNRIFLTLMFSMSSLIMSLADNWL